MPIHHMGWQWIHRTTTSMSMKVTRYPNLTPLATRREPQRPVWDCLKARSVSRWTLERLPFPTPAQAMSPPTGRRCCHLIPLPIARLPSTVSAHRELARLPISRPPLRANTPHSLRPAADRLRQRGPPEIYRYDALSEKLECTSCSPTSEQATGEASLPADGLGLTEDGRVFFNSPEGLVDRDLNEIEDAYEWEPAGIQTPKRRQTGSGATCETSAGASI